MKTYSPLQTSEWVAGKLREAVDVLNVEVVSDRVLQISRKKYAPFIAGVVCVVRVEAATIKELVESKLGVEIIANVPKEAYWTGEALRLARSRDIATGAFGDLLRVIDFQEVRNFQSQETIFVERGLRQHDRIFSFDRVHDRLYLISRNELPDLRVAMLNEYELTADGLRVDRDRYGAFSVVVITDPNGRATSAAEAVAQTMGVEIFKWGPFFGRLNRK